VDGQRHAPAALPPGRPGTHFIGGSMGPRAGLDVCGKFLPPPEFDPRTVQPNSTVVCKCESTAVGDCLGSGLPAFIGLVVWSSRTWGPGVFVGRLLWSVEMFFVMQLKTCNI
jgi:hypothetical protein